jgi:hypothetical protein
METDAKKIASGGNWVYIVSGPESKMEIPGISFAAWRAIMVSAGVERSFIDGAMDPAVRCSRVPKAKETHHEARTHRVFSMCVSCPYGPGSEDNPAGCLR